MDLNMINKQIVSIKQHIPLLDKKTKHICEQYEVSYDELLLEMLKYLHLVSIAKQPLSPSHVVDLIWHEFILFTRYYNDFCFHNYSRFIHHTPSANEDPSNFYKTLKFYILTFNKPPEKIWGNMATAEWNSANCGTCHN